MISCCACGLKSHVGCYGFPTEREVPDKVLCYFCARDNPELEEYRELCTVDPQMNPQQAMVRLSIVEAASRTNNFVEYPFYLQKQVY